jgi:predicted aldo/keto reductase-like oxidoreductase
MKAIPYGRQAKLPATELLRYTLSRDGVHTVVVGLDRLSHLDEDAGVATGFRSMKAAERFQLYKNAESALAGVVPPWEHPGYVDGTVVS